MNNLESIIIDFVEILSRVITQTYTFVALFVQKILENNFRRRLCKQDCKKEFIEQEISTPSFISDMPFTLCISQCIIHQKYNYFLSVRGDTVLHV